MYKISIRYSNDFALKCLINANTMINYKIGVFKHLNFALIVFENIDLRMALQEP